MELVALVLVPELVLAMAQSLEELEVPVSELARAQQGLAAALALVQELGQVLARAVVQVEFAAEQIGLADSDCSSCACASWRTTTVEAGQLAGQRRRASE
jgi:hypothetical protein